MPVGDQALWWFVLGFFSVWAIKVLNNWTAEPWKRAAAAFVFCLLVGFADSYFRNALNPAQVISSTLVVLASAIVFYNLWFKSLVP